MERRWGLPFHRSSLSRLIHSLPGDSLSSTSTKVTLHLGLFWTISFFHVKLQPAPIQRLRKQQTHSLIKCATHKAEFCSVTLVQKKVLIPSLPEVHHDGCPTSQTVTKKVPGQRSVILFCLKRVVSSALYVYTSSLISGKPFAGPPPTPHRHTCSIRPRTCLSSAT